MKSLSVRLSFLFAAGILLCITACVPPASLKLAQQAQANGDLVAAHAHYVQTLQESPGNAEALQALAAIRDQLSAKARAEADAMFRSATPATARTIRASTAILDKSAAYDPDGSRLGGDRQKFQQALAQLNAKNDQRIEAANRAMAANQFPQARTLIDEIQATDPDYDGLDALQNNWTRAYGAFLEQSVQQAYAAGNLSQANQAVEKWQALGFPAADQARMQTIVKTADKKLISGRVADLMARQQFYKAHLLLTRSRYKSEYGSLFSDVSNRGAPFYLEQARLRLAEGDVSRAYLEAVKGLELDPNLPGMFEIHRDTRDAVLEKVQKYIAIPAFDAPTTNPDAGTRFSDALISYLFRILPYGINIVERGKIDILMQEHKREVSEVATILNVDLIVTGNVSLLKVDRQDNQRQATVRAPVGEKTEINPEYEIWIKTGGDQSNQPAPPKTIKVPEYGNFTINKGSSVVKGFANVAVRIFDTSKGRITYAQEFNANFQTSDDYQDALELAGIEGDPLNVPTDTEVQEKLRSQIVKQLADVIQQQFEKREKHFLQTADYYKSRKERRLAIQELARGFLYCVKAKVPFNDSDFTAIREEIIDLTETGFLAPTSDLASGEGT